QPGEPPRVQPSRRRRGQAGAGRRVPTKPLIEIGRSARKGTPWRGSSGGRRGTPRPPRTSGPPTSWSTRCAGAPPPGRASASTSSTSPGACARRRSRSIPTPRPRSRAAGTATSLRRPSEDLGELGGRSDLELIVAALRRPFVGTPAHEGGRMPEAGALQVVVLHLADALDPERLPGEVLALAPAAGGARHPSPSLQGPGPP